MTLLAFAVVAFALIHLVPAVPPVKARLQQALGAAYGAVFGIAATAALVLIVVGWNVRLCRRLRAADAAAPGDRRALVAGLPQPRRLSVPRPAAPAFAVSARHRGHAVGGGASVRQRRPCEPDPVRRAHRLCRGPSRPGALVRHQAVARNAVGPRHPLHGRRRGALHRHGAAAPGADRSAGAGAYVPRAPSCARSPLRGRP
jgi:hypothetical protein